MTARVTVAVLHYDRPERALACVQSVLASAYPAFDVLVLDNGSAPARLAELRAGLAALESASRPAVQLVTLKDNRGYTGGVNAAFEAALATQAPYVWLLADDVRVAPDAMSALVAALESHARAGIAGAMTYEAAAPERIWFAGGSIERSGMGRARHRGLGERDHGQYSSIERVDYANGSSLFARREVVAALGGLDEAYFTYWEDADWCARAQRAGWEVVFVPAARVWHDVTPDEGARLDRARFYDGRNRMLWHSRHRPGRLWAVVLLTFLAWPGYLLQGRPREGWLQVKGVLAFLAGSRGRSS